MSKHTPGPWTVQEREHSFRVVDSRALKFDNSRLCDVQHWAGATRGPDREEARANARLIAAAPELLEALKLCAVLVHDGNRQGDAAIEAAHAAIAKATGGEV